MGRFLSLLPNPPEARHAHARSNHGAGWKTESHPWRCLIAGRCHSANRRHLARRGRWQLVLRFGRGGADGIGLFHRPWPGARRMDLCRRRRHDHHLGLVRIRPEWLGIGAAPSGANGAPFDRRTMSARPRSDGRAQAQERAADRDRRCRGLTGRRRLGDQPAESRSGGARRPDDPGLSGPGVRHPNRRLVGLWRRHRRPALCRCRPDQPVQRQDPEARLDLPYRRSAGEVRGRNDAAEGGQFALWLYGDEQAVRRRSGDRPEEVGIRPAGRQKIYPLHHRLPQCRLLPCAQCRGRHALRRSHL